MRCRTVNSLIELVSAFDPLQTFVASFSNGRMKFTIVAAMAVLLLPPQSALAAKRPTKLEGMVYVKARPIILGYGWRPLPGDCGGADQLTCARYPEIGNCSGTGVGFCDMTFTRRSRCLVIVTVGGEPRADKRGEPTVRDLQFRVGPCSKN